MTRTGAWRPYLLAWSFTCACLNMLASGSLYVFALYAPSFTGHLGYTQTQTSTIAVIGDIGLYGFGPLSGFMADRFGPRATSVFAGCLLALGYNLLSAGYAAGLESVAKHESPTHFLLMGIFLFLAGIGSSASYMAAFTSLARNFQRSRGIALGIPVSFFGLSAAVLTLVAQSYFMKQVDGKLKSFRNEQELDSVQFLRFLGLAGGLVNAMAVVGMNVLPPAPEKTPAPHHIPEPNTVVATTEPSEQAPLLQGNHNPRVQASPSDSDVTISYESSTALRVPIVHSVSGKAFFLNRDAQFFFLVMICLSGTGLMIINSISAMVDTVAAAASEVIVVPPTATLTAWMDEGSPLASIRAKHVALISLSSYAGRIVAGLGSDVAMTRWNAHRIDVLPVASAVMALAQVAGMFMPLHWLYLCSSFTGLAYGAFFGVAGIIVAELWGADTCGQNW
ncbi:hypothetical protein BGX28_007983 [Mortierella sp. GBA30]|nr:hypothetical protein BGX28_007983 [Mortierella sp. GBA30]